MQPRESFRYNAEATPTSCKGLESRWTFPWWHIVPGLAYRCPAGGQSGTEWIFIEDGVTCSHRIRKLPGISSWLFVVKIPPPRTSFRIPSHFLPADICWRSWKMLAAALPLSGVMSVRYGVSLQWLDGKWIIWNETVWYRTYLPWLVSFAHFGRELERMVLFLTVIGITYPA